MNLSVKEQEMLIRIKNKKRLPIVRFELRTSKDSSIFSVTLNHVLMATADDTMETVKATSALLQNLQDAGLIQINYSLRMSMKSDYAVYYDSDVYKLFCQTVSEGKETPGFLFDTPYIKRGIVTAIE